MEMRVLFVLEQVHSKLMNEIIGLGALQDALESDYRDLK
jgi:hypothetical protein